ncbi:DUF2264 domain-containing protein [Novosphingobium terrae]|uniref:DUF2264 domain-containing protein n=1 Tax=Novosphingobium terrae TaxID=2726189 RepID=UPI001980912A|nr:DUF2264 domain-containing protein [Novosphingobium terrae]
MERRDFIVSALGAGALATTVAAQPARAAKPAGPSDGMGDRGYMLALLEKMAVPVLGPMSQGRLHAQFKPELSPTWDGRSPQVAYLECFGRLIAGLAPWLALNGDAGPEASLRQHLRDQALASYAYSVDPSSPDYLKWQGEGQALVDSAYFSNALMRAPKVLWEPLDAKTRAGIVRELKGLRSVSPPYSNWLLFAAMNEAFLLSIGEAWDPIRLGLAIRKIDEWYVGDGWYSDGPHFHFDYYGAYVIHPMLVEILEVLVASGEKLNGMDARALLDRAWVRMERYATSLERMISPDGTYPPVGRSLTYRTAVFQPLGLLALRKRLPALLPEGKARSALLAAQRRIFSNPGNFNAEGYLTLGFCGHQPMLADVYSNSGSMYLASLSLLPLGLGASDSFWTSPAQPWTQKLAYAGQPFAKDHYMEE